MKPTTLQYPAGTSKASYRQLEQAMLQMRHPRNALIRHRDAAHGAHRHAFSLNLQNPHLTDLHRREPTFKKYACRLLESVAREVNKSCRTYFKLPDIGRPNTASPIPEPHVAAGSRPSQSVFRCTSCSHGANADMNAAASIRHQGLLTLPRAGNPLGMPPEARWATKRTTPPPGGIALYT